MKFTNSLKLKKPDGSDFYDVENFNYNADVIDEELEKVNSEIGQKLDKSGGELSGNLILPSMKTSTYTLKSFPAINMVNPQGKNEIEIDLGGGYFAGVLEITLTSGYNVGNASGAIKKIIDFIGTTHVASQNSKYTHVGLNTGKYFMISDIYVKNGKKYIKIVQNEASRNSAIITLQGYGIFENLESATAGTPVASTEIFVEPTGITINSSGLNSNGKWLRFEDGTQICNGIISLSNVIVAASEGALFISSPIVVTYPSTFIAKPSLTFSPESGVNRYIIQPNNAIGLSSCPIVLLSTKSNTIGNMDVYYIAIGRWK